VLPTADYSGTRDTWISSVEPTQNFGSGAQMQVQKASASQNPLLKWDVTSIPPGSRVISAEITFWATGKFGGQAKIFNLLKPWDEYQATWKSAKAGFNWGTAGAASDGDRGPRPVALLSPEKPGFVTIALSELI